MLMEKIVQGRFKGNPREVFGSIRRCTKYDQYDKRDGGIMTRAIDSSGNFLTGQDLDTAILLDYQKIHG